jgi:hypothetical protein
MNNLDIAIKRVLTNVVFGCFILLILVLAVTFRYYIDKQNNLNMDELNQIVEEEITKNEY